MDEVCSTDNSSPVCLMTPDLLHSSTPGVRGSEAVVALVYGE
jgi:hypothetical protein